MEITPEDLKFPKSVISRIVKEALPEGANISQEAKTAIARSAAIFILHATSLANDNAMAKKRKNVTADDILYAVRQLECEELEKPILEGLDKFNQKRMHKLQVRKVWRDRKRASTSQNMTADGDEGDENEEAEDNDREESDAEEEEVEEEGTANDQEADGDIIALDDD